MTKLIDLTGMKFGMLLVIEKSGYATHPSGQKHLLWKCLCDCGNYCDAEGQKLRNGTTKHCGCDYGQIIDLKGRRFGRLLVIEKANRPSTLKDRNQYWLCKCDCGNEKIIRSHSLLNDLTISCGCYNREKASEMAKKQIGTKRPNQSLEFGMAALHALYSHYRISARRRNLPFEVSIERFVELIDGDCSYCGCVASQIKFEKGYNGYYIYNGIDRIDNTKGYVNDNVTTCCGKCNRMKWQMTMEEFEEHIIQVYNFLMDKRNEKHDE
jgi:hypothetical protein